VRAIAADIAAGVPVGVVSGAFHDAVAVLVADLATEARRRTGLDRVGLTGGVFQNVTLIERSVAHLRAAGFHVLTHRRVPPNDGGLALGQAVVATTIFGTRAGSARRKG
jgi:hydrogenase maturation protein HypF